ncbi:MAG: MATE family efflux transporter [Synergistaceae bacterium]|nr:MATE family efflux transporter [Synergistaceae bacterium]
MNSETKSIHRQVISNIIPAIIVEIMILIYNLADTFFISQTNDPYQIAAVSLASPVFMMLITMGIVIMAGGMSCISRALGAGDKQKADSIASFCVWTGIAVGFLMTLVFMVFIGKILIAIGASINTFVPAYAYLSIVMASAPFVLFSMACSGIMRAENHATQAMNGQIIGNVVNIILDPIMILYMKMGITGAAIATVLGTVAGAAYYIGYFLAGQSSLSINIKNFKVKAGIAAGVFSIGIPGALDPCLMSISQMIMNSLMSAYGDMAVAAAGVSMRIEQIATLIAMGCGQGVQPLLGFCVGAKDWDRYKGILKFALQFAISVSIFMVAMCYIFTGRVVRVFLINEEAFNYAFNFLRIKLTSSVLFAVFFIFVNALQAMGAAMASFVLSVCRQCVLYVPLLFIMNYFMGAYGLIWALPMAELLSLLQTVILYGKIVFEPKIFVVEKKSR